MKLVIAKPCVAEGKPQPLGAKLTVKEKSDQQTLLASGCAVKAGSEEAEAIAKAVAAAQKQGAGK
ncbi:hypothetical protein ACL7TT_14625 [Microbulbifer sp. 2304DJ12-6]|uniref:hypothetical protein n=1 Tax=Microbulbifer sp. 2304DJ12-6 TaxID=3233340 RepID=UPI0039AEFC77